ncbi:hypothetical protein [Piscibacillus salipiscarius]|uniref:hypothetical protein n=1 Tax=Piscibacillus salipiscarius TaxID=299480 RepID=UPI0024364C11|nr:hypothetical protein [Piscibacillus salipiscarius]
MVPPIDLAKKRTYNQEEMEEIKQNRKRTLIGTPRSIKKQLESLQDLYDTDEFFNHYQHI